MIVTAITVLLPVFFVLGLGYFAGRVKKFDADQVAGFNDLVLDYALPAMLFVATVKTPRERLLSEGSYALALLIALNGEAALQANLTSFPSVVFFWSADFPGVVRRVQPCVDCLRRDFIDDHNHAAHGRPSGN